MTQMCIGVLLSSHNVVNDNKHKHRTWTKTLNIILISPILGRPRTSGATDLPVNTSVMSYLITQWIFMWRHTLSLNIYVTSYLFSEDFCDVIPYQWRFLWRHTLSVKIYVTSYLISEDCDVIPYHWRFIWRHTLSVKTSVTSSYLISEDFWDVSVQFSRRAV